MRKTILAAAAAALLALGACALAGCSSQDQSAQEGNVEKPTLTVAMELAYPPFETKDDAGNPAGIAVDFMSDFADQYGYELVIENTAEVRRCRPARPTASSAR